MAIKVDRQMAWKDGNDGDSPGFQFTEGLTDTSSKCPCGCGDIDSKCISCGLCLCADCSPGGEGASCPRCAHRGVWKAGEEPQESTPNPVMRGF